MRQNGFTLVELLVVIAIIALLAAILFPALTSAQEKGRQAQCLSNQHQLAVAALGYAEDHDGMLPPDAATAHSLASGGIGVCPSAPRRTGYGYGYSHALDGLALSEAGAGDPTAVVLFCDATAPDLTPATLALRHHGKTVAAYLDGHVELTGSPSLPGAGVGVWPMFLHDAQHTGRSQFKGPTQPVLKWKVALTNMITNSAPVVGGDGTIFCTGEQPNTLNTVDPAHGTLRWKWPSETCFASAAAIGTDGTIYLGSSKFYALNPLNGAVKWTFAAPSDWQAAPTIGDDGTIYLGSRDTNVYALNPDGSCKWKFPTGGAVTTSPALGSDGTVYIGSIDHKLYALNPTDGSCKWSYAVSGSVDLSSPVIGEDGTIYFGSGYITISNGTYEGGLYALTPNGALKWKFTIPYTDPLASMDHLLHEYATPAIGTDGTVYYGACDSNLYALNPGDGSCKWQYFTNNNIQAAPAIGADGTLYLMSNGNTLYVLSPSGSCLCQCKLTIVLGAISFPAIGADGTLYVGSCSDGYLYAYK